MLFTNILYMKYTKYILSGDCINVNSMITHRPIIKQITIVGAIPVVTVGIIALAGILPGAIMMDNSRYVKLKYYQYRKQYNRRKQFNRIIQPLTPTKADKKQLWAKVKEMSFN